MGSAEFILFLALALIAFAIYNFVVVLMDSNDDAGMLWADDNEPSKSKSGFIEISRPLAHFFAMGLARKVEMPSYRASIEKSIKTAGLFREINTDEFIGIQIFWGFFFPLIMSIINFTFELGFPMPLILGLTVVGAYFPHMHCKKSKQIRTQSVLLDLPFYVDLLALATEAGLEFVSAIQRVVEKSQDGSILAEELGNVLRDIKLGRSRADALRDFATRLDMPEVTSLVAVLIDSGQTGVGIGTVLKQQTEQMRMERFSRAEKEGAKASQYILIPMLMFIMPAVFIMVFGPVVLQFMGQGN